MTAAFDPRIIKVGLQIKDDFVTFKDLSITISGTKFGSAQMNQCQATIVNLTKEHKNYILTQASILKLQRTPINMTVDIGRESYGTFRIFEGTVTSGLSSQPPDIGVSLQSLTNNAMMGFIKGSSLPANSSVQQIAQKIASDNNLTLNFQADGASAKKIENYSYSGAVAKQVAKLAQIADINAFVDNGQLVVLDIGKAKHGDVRVISAGTGMVGVPEVTEKGVRCKVMIDNSIQLFGRVQVKSEQNPAANGYYDIVKIDFEAATREQPFWYILDCISIDRRLGSS